MFSLLTDRGKVFFHTSFLCDSQKTSVFIVSNASLGVSFFLLICVIFFNLPVLSIHRLFINISYFATSQTKYGCFCPPGDSVFLIFVFFHFGCEVNSAMIFVVRVVDNLGLSFWLPLALFWSPWAHRWLSVALLWFSFHSICVSY